MSTEATVMVDPRSQSPTEDIVLSYYGSNNNVPSRNVRRNVMAHTRNISLPTSYFNPNPTTAHNHAHRRYSTRNLSRDPSGSNKSITTEGSNNDRNYINHSEMQNLINSVDKAIEESATSPQSFNADDSTSKQKQKHPLRHQKSRSINSGNGTPVSSPSPSSPTSIRSVHQFTHIQKKRLSRTIQNISSFVQIVVIVTPTISLPITIEKTYTIERLARQIEAEYAFKFCGIEQNGTYEPLEVGLLYDVSMISLRFRDLVGDVLEHGDVVNVLNICEGYHRRPDRTEDLEVVANDIEFENFDSCIEKDFPSDPNTLPSEVKAVERRHSMPTIHLQNNHKLTNPSNSTKVLPQPNSPGTTSSGSTPTLTSILQIENEIQALETRFQSVLSNTLALDYFQKFAIREFSIENLLFWLDVELFAAGISCDIEDNYFEEQQTAVVHASYIYLTYISSNAPLQVNLSDDIRKDVTWPINDEDNVERNMFDEAQEAVYQLMKGHTFTRFEESIEWEECLKRKESDPEEYQNHEMTKPLERYFRPNMSLMLAITMALDPSIEQPQISHHYKEQNLHSILSQYFPETVLLDNKGKRKGANNNESPENSVLNGYFDSENRLTNAQRMKRIKKEKKLQWVFGEKVDRMDDQIVVIPGKPLDGIDDDTNSILSTVSENRRIGKEVWNRKKKIDKLESIFGRGLKDSQLYSQNILRGKGQSLSGTLYHPPGTQNFSSEIHDSPRLKTMNELSAKDRRMLWKKNKKLQVMLGEALDEDMVRQALTLPVIQSTPIQTPNDEMFGGDESKMNDQYDGRSKSFGSNILSRKNRISRRASDSMIPSPPPEKTANATLSSIMTPPASPVSPDEKPSNNTDKSETVPLMVVNKDTKEYRRKKLQKLHRFLGEKVPVNVILDEGECDHVNKSLPPLPTSPLPSPSPPQSKPKNKKRPNSLYFNKKNSTETSSVTSNQPDTSFAKLSAMDRKRHLQRAVKLQKMFGETPPQNLILSQPKHTSDDSSELSTSSNIDLHRQSIISLEYLMENNKEIMYELIDYMAHSDEGETQDDHDNHHQRNSVSSSAPPTPYSSSSPNFPLLSQHNHNKPHKQTKLKGIRKLSHFFGATYGQMFPDQVIGELLVDLEREIREEAKQNEQLDESVVAGLMGQLEELKAKTGEFGPDFNEEYSFVTTDDEYSSEGLRKTLEEDRKNTNIYSF